MCQIVGKWISEPGIYQYKGCLNPIGLEACSNPAQIRAGTCLYLEQFHPFLLLSRGAFCLVYVHLVKTGLNLIVPFIFELSAQE